MYSYIVTVLELVLVILTLIKATYRQDTLYILSREWPYLSCTELVAKPFYLLLCSIIILVCITMFVKEMVIKIVYTKPTVSFTLHVFIVLYWLYL